VTKDHMHHYTKKEAIDHTEKQITNLAYKVAMKIILTKLKNGLILTVKIKNFNIMYYYKFINLSDDDGIVFSSEQPISFEDRQEYWEWYLSLIENDPDPYPIPFEDWLKKTYGIEIERIDWEITAA